MTHDSFLFVFMLFNLATVPVWALSGSEELAAEIKVLVDQDDIEHALNSFGLYAVDAQLADVAFFDLRDLGLNSAGLILRARSRGDESDVTVKIRPGQAKMLKKWGRKKGFKCEHDQIGAKDTMTCSWTKTIKSKKIEQVFAGKRSAQDLFDLDLRQFAESQIGGLPWGSLQVFGVIQSWGWDFHLVDGSKVSVELWSLGDGKLKILEFSTRVEKASEAEAGLERIQKLLQQHLVRPETVQSSKTKAALDFYLSGWKGRSIRCERVFLVSEN